MGGYNFNLLGDDEEQKKLADQESVLQELLGGADDQAPTVDQTPAPLQASTTDPKVADFQARLDQAKAARAASMGSTDDSSVLDDLVAQHEHRSHTAGDIDTALAMLLDLGANKGRGLGQIVGAYASNRDHEASQDEHFKEQVAFAKAKKKDADPVAEALRTQAVLNAMAGHETTAERETRLAQGQNFNQQKVTPGTDPYKGVIQQKEDLAAAGVKGKTNEETALADQIDENARGKAAASAQGSTSATTNELRLNPRDITPEQQAQLDIETKRLQQSQQAHEDAQANAEATRAATAETRRQGELNSFRTQTKDMLSALQKARDLQKQIDNAGGKDVPGLDNLDYNLPNAMLSRDAIHNQEILQQLINPETKRYFGTAVSANEASARERAYGTGRLSGEAAREEAIKTIREGLESGVRGAAAGREDAARAVLKEYGLDDLLPAQAAAVVEDAPASARDALPEQRVPEGDALSVQPGAATKVRDVIGGSNNPKATDVQLRSPKGRVGVLTLTPDELKKYEAAGWTVL